MFLLCSVFYYVLGNLSPKYRSTLKAIQLLTIMKHSLLQQYGIHKVLEAFMKDIRMLESVSPNYMYCLLSSYSSVQLSYSSDLYVTLFLISSPSKAGAVAWE